MLPSIFGENMFDDWFNAPFGSLAFPEHNPLYGKHAKALMKTDIRQTENGYELDIDLPGFKKEDIKAHVENGYLTVQASKGLDKETKDKKGEFIRRERYSGQCSRSYYVGESITEADIHAKYEDGILHLTLPKKETPTIPEKRYISIE